MVRLPSSIVFMLAACYPSFNLSPLGPESLLADIYILRVSLVVFEIGWSARPPGDFNQDPLNDGKHPGNAPSLSFALLLLRKSRGHVRRPVGVET